MASSLSHVERRVLLDHYGRWLWVMRMMPCHAAFWLSGVYLPPHERAWLDTYFSDIREITVVASRGTSKSFTHASLAAPLKSFLYKNKRGLILSASGFRGGKQLMKDAERLFKGQLRSQKSPGDFLTESVTTQKILQKDPSSWSISLGSFSDVMTVPTKDPETLRGLRATDILSDEANQISSEVRDGIIRPIANVGGDFIRTATAGDDNKFIEISTIDFSHRDFAKRVTEARKLARTEYEAQQARKEGNWEEYDRLMDENDGALKTASFSTSRVDYTDLLIPRFIEDGETQEIYEVKYPLPKGVKAEDMLRYDERDRQEIWFVYPVPKDSLEEPLRNGTADEDLWKAEQRNVFINASGNVFGFDLIQRVAERPIYEQGQVPGRGEDSDEYYPPVLFSCGDPCVIGADYARESDEFAIVVIRLGELAKGDFDPDHLTLDEKGRPLLGWTPWNSVVWAESWKRLPTDKASERLRSMLERYNVVATVNIGGMALDKRYGSGVRDDLAQPKPPVGPDGIPEPGWTMPIRIFDPNDADYAHFAALDEPDKYWSGLRLLATQNADNLNWTAYVKGQMQARKLYLGYSPSPSKWAADAGLTNAFGQPDKSNPEFQKLRVGYEGLLRLKKQLLALQVQTTGQTIRYVVPADRSKEAGKKDIYSALIYAGHLAREHLLAQTKEDTVEAPMVAPIVINAHEFQRYRIR